MKVEASELGPEVMSNMLYLHTQKGVPTVNILSYFVLSQQDILITDSQLSL